MQACAAAGCHALHARACDTCSPHMAGFDRLARLAADGLHCGQGVWCEAWQPLEQHREPHCSVNSIAHVPMRARVRMAIEHCQSASSTGSLLSFAVQEPWRLSATSDGKSQNL